MESLHGHASQQEDQRQRGPDQPLIADPEGRLFGLLFFLAKALLFQPLHDLGQALLIAIADTDGMGYGVDGHMKHARRLAETFFQGIFHHPVEGGVHVDDLTADVAAELKAQVAGDAIHHIRGDDGWIVLQGELPGRQVHFHCGDAVVLAQCVHQQLRALTGGLRVFGHEEGDVELLFDHAYAS